MAGLPEERDQKILPELVDYQIAIAMANDIENRSGGYLVRALAEWVATIREHDYEKRD